MFQINGKLTNKINIKDRAVQYGDGVFETIAVKENLLEFWKEHYHRSVSYTHLTLPTNREV